MSDILASIATRNVSNTSMIYAVMTNYAAGFLSAIACPSCEVLHCILNNSSLCYSCGRQIALKLARATKYQEFWQCGLRRPDGMPCAHPPSSLSSCEDTAECNNMTHAKHVYRLLQRDINDVSKSLWTLVAPILRSSMGAFDSETQLIRKFSKDFHKVIHHTFHDIRAGAHPDSEDIVLLLTTSSNDDMAAIRSRLILYPKSLASLNKSIGADKDMVYAVMTNSLVQLLLQKRKDHPHFNHQPPFLVTTHVELQIIINQVAALTGEDHIGSLDAFCLTVARLILAG